MFDQHPTRGRKWGLEDSDVSVGPKLVVWLAAVEAMRAVHLPRRESQHESRRARENATCLRTPPGACGPLISYVEAMPFEPQVLHPFAHHSIDTCSPAIDRPASARFEFRYISSTPDCLLQTPGRTIHRHSHFHALRSRKPYHFSMLTFALLSKLSTTPMESSLSERK